MSGIKVQIKAFSDFKCIGGSCISSCCEYWNDIHWTKDEVEHLREQECSPELNELINTSFQQKPDGNYSIREVNCMCPFLDERKFCRIQLELGHEMLSHTCRSYPRKATFNNGVVMNRLSCSCVEVLRLLLNDPKAAELVKTYFHDTQKVNAVETNEDFYSRPELKFRNDIFQLLYDVIHDSSYSVETGIVLGALAMQKISEYAEKKQAERIPEVIKAIKPQLKNKAQIEKLEQIKPNYALKFTIVEDLISDKVSAEALHNEDGSPSIGKYAEGEKKFAEILGSRDYAMRNLFINLMMDLNMPSFSKQHTLYENYCYFVSCVASIKYLSAVMGYAGGDIEESFKHIVALVCRNFAHNYKQIDLVLARMKQLNCTSPAYLASLIK